MPTSYSNLGGTGDRRRLVKITASAIFQSYPYYLVNGNPAANGFFGSGAAAGEYLEFDWGDRTPVIDEFGWDQSTSDTHGTWKFRGWDGASWVDIGSSGTLGG